VKAIKWTLAILTLLVLLYFVYNWWDNRNYFDSSENGRFTIQVGETFQFKLSENGSTGYQNCWVNPGKCSNVEFVDKTYASSLQSKLGYIGSGGVVTFYFKGIKKGFDTIAMAHCPTGREQKDCSQFSSDSIGADNLFVVEIR